MANGWPYYGFAGMIVLGFAMAIIMLRNPARYGDPDRPPSRAMLMIEIAFVLLLMGGCAANLFSIDQGDALHRVGLATNTLGICAGIVWIVRLMRQFKDAT